MPTVKFSFTKARECNYTVLLIHVWYLYICFCTWYAYDKERKCADKFSEVGEIDKSLIEQSSQTVFGNSYGHIIVIFISAYVKY